MCQLTFTDLGSPLYNRCHLFNATQINSWTSHKDGYGFWADGKRLFKTELQASHTSNFGHFINSYVKTGIPVMSHVRLASTGYKQINYENTHPFLLSDIVFCHNGTMEFRDKKEGEDPRVKGKTDSHSFAILLNEEYSKSKNMYEALEKTYEHFYGKFAFMIFSKSENTFYIARGSTAKLFISDVYYEIADSKKGERVGFVVNTDDLDLGKALVFTTNQAQFLGGKPLTWDYPKELVENSVHKYNPQTRSLDFVGDLKEERRPVAEKPAVVPFQESAKAIQVSTEKTPTTMNSQNGSVTSGDKKTVITGDKFSETATSLLSFLFDMDLDVEDLDRLMFVTLGVCLLQAGREELSVFIDTIIPALKARRNDEKHLQKEWSKLTLNGFYTSSEMILRFDLQFPWFLNSVKDVRDARKKLEKEEAIEGNWRNANETKDESLDTVQ